MISQMMSLLYRWRYSYFSQSMYFVYSYVLFEFVCWYLVPYQALSFCLFWCCCGLSDFNDISKYSNSLEQNLYLALLPFNDVFIDHVSADHMFCHPSEYCLLSSLEVSKYHIIKPLCLHKSEIFTIDCFHELIKFFRFLSGFALIWVQGLF